MTTQTPFHIFYCYAREDKGFRDALDRHLAGFKRQHLLSTWSDREIKAGEEWKTAIDTNLQQAHIVLCLVSPDFLASDYCYEKEMQQALERHKQGTARVIPILVRPTYWENTPLSELQMLPSDAMAVVLWPHTDAAWVDVVSGILLVIQELSSLSKAQKSQPENAPAPSNANSQSSHKQRRNLLTTMQRMIQARVLNNKKDYTIAVVGDVASGKSLYIASCIYQLLQEQAAQVIGFNSITGLGNTTEVYHSNYFKPIYLYKQNTSPTQSAGPSTPYQPLIYKLEFSDRPPVNLLFYDAEGGDIVDQANMVVYSHFILDASAIIFLADPIQMPGIVQTLPVHLRPGSGTLQQLTPTQVLARVIYTFKQYKGGNIDRNVSIPIAITVSKSDLLKFAAVLNPQSALYLSDNTYTRHLDTSEFATISSQIKELLKVFGDRHLLLASEQFENVCFFAVSATGCAPDDRGEFPSIEPKRCLDPLLWALWKLGIIDPERS